MKQYIPSLILLLLGLQPAVISAPFCSDPLETPADEDPSEGAAAADDLPALLPPPKPADLARHALNNLRLPALLEGGAHSFLVGGHLYGAPPNKESVFPSPSLLANISRLNESGADYFITQGDMARFLSERHLELLRRSFVERLEIPLWIAVGNHDTANRERFQKAFNQPTVGFLSVGPVLHLVLDSELDPGRISGAQLEFLRDSLAAAQDIERVRCVMIHSHKLIWGDGREDLQAVFRHVNSLRGYAQEGDFVRDVLPSVRALAVMKPVVWVSGDIGTMGRPPLFHHREPDVDLQWVATGLGDVADDSLLQVHVSAEGEFRFEVLRMDGHKAPPLEDYGVDFWTKFYAKR